MEEFSLMARTKGARDLKRRKSRRDKKKKYVRHKGKFVPYVSKRGKSDPIKIWWWQVLPMSLDGYKNWNSTFRARLKKIVYKPLIRVDVPADRLSTRESIGDLAIETIGFDGNFLLKGFSHGRNKWHVKNVTLCKIKIVETPEGLKAFVTDTWRLSRYWFWRK
jgi:hypothetical protein